MPDTFAGKSDETVKKATGKTWDEWFKILNKKGAADMPHKDIARMLFDEGQITSGWWCQTVTVGYEQKIGRRVWGQTSTGHFAVTTSVTLPGNIDGVLAAWEDLADGKTAFNGLKIDKSPRISATEKWRYWRVRLEDESKISVNIGMKNGEQVLLSINHDNLKDKNQADEWKKFWVKFLTQL